MSLLQSFAAEMLRCPPDVSPSAWCEENLYIPPPQTQTEGWFRLTGREYCREFIDDFGNARVTDEVACFGSQTAKTTSLMAGVAWCISEDPCGILWVMPNLELARSFSETRWIPLVNHSPVLFNLRPSGSRRHDFKKTQQQIGAAIINFIGSNSPANLASRPARRVILDEVDKFDEGGKGEADATNLAEQRTKSFANPQRFKTSTPTLSDGLIWQEFLKGDQRRYFIPCVHCGKHVILAWSQHFTMFKLLGCEAFVKWDQEAKRKDDWDLDRVYRSAHAECPHCGGHINDGHKTKMVREGQWRPTAQSASSFRSRHLSSLYASSPETGFGRLAIKFLQAKQSLMGLQGFINGDLAEPWENQDVRAERIECFANPNSAPIQNGAKILTVDVQRTAPYFWFVVREWNGNSRLADCGSLDDWEQIRAKQLEHGIADHLVGIDAGDQTEVVYTKCIAYSRIARAKNPATGRGELVWVGWTPMKGFERREQWKHERTKKILPYNLGAAAVQSQAILKLLEFSDNHSKDILWRLRSGRTSFRWEVVREKADETYWKHLDSETKKAFHNARTNRVSYEWVKLGKRWPNHMYDCEVMQVVKAMFHGLLPWAEQEKRPDG